MMFPPEVFRLEKSEQQVTANTFVSGWFGSLE